MATTTRIRSRFRPVDLTASDPEKADPTSTESRQVDVAAQAWLKQVQSVIGEALDREVILVPNANNKILFLNWRVWCLRYSVGLPFIVRVILDRYSRMARRNYAQTQKLGLPVAAITGPAAQQVVEEAVLREFPANENIDSQRSTRQFSMLFTSSMIGLKPNDKTMDTYNRLYRRKAKWKRAHALAGARFRRPWRGNPWKF